MPSESLPRSSLWRPACLAARPKSAREFAHRATASMVGVNIGVAAPMAYFPFGGSRDSFFGDLKVHGRDAFEFYTDKKVTITRWP
jgi:malonate-semialdehyde dehydrogenase (acetylating)/methylmalonate-semialdehyde dehydrogenase